MFDFLLLCYMRLPVFVGIPFLFSCLCFLCHDSLPPVDLCPIPHFMYITMLGNLDHSVGNEIIRITMT